MAPNGNGSKIIKLRSREFRIWLAHFGRKSLGKPIIASVLQTAITTLEGMAIHESEEHALYMRAASLNGALWYDLGDGRAVKIDKSGWEVSEKPPILFYRLQHQKPQVMPVKGGNFGEIFDLLPKPEDGGERLLLMAWLATSLMQGFPHPILLVHGEKGSRKTTLFKLIRRLIDPSLLETLSPQGDLREFTQQASHNYFLPLDNLSPIKKPFSNILCRTVTGEGFSKRELFSDDDDVIYSFQRMVGVNGINLVLSEPDALDRSVIINLAPPEEYEEDEPLFARFEAARPRLLGALFDIIVQAINQRERLGEIKGLESSRMAGFAKWGYAVTSALGIEAKDFIAALESNKHRQHDEVMDTSPVASVVAHFMEGFIGEWCGTPTTLFADLRRHAEGMKIDPNKKPFPQSVSWLWKRLEDVIPNLREQGIIVTRDRDNERLIHIAKPGSAAFEGTTDLGPGGQGYDLGNMPKVEVSNEVEGIPF